ncbi:alginate export family protein [Permianibacter sp. IMCC34836]|uniref:alginate export family protein n=1 Tax=Permianibacter fluminis TaxID=2738515 RepID=UPI001557DD3F|nr:alginate export family protein [Permianibacter fluminis]NQD37850.1 alginate export family protein [Permianibacter fluminis]
MAMLLGVSFVAATSTAAKEESTNAPGVERPTPAEPYPLAAAGWGPELGNGLFASRWAEDWTSMRAAGTAPLFKGMPIGDEASLTLNAETRWRYDVVENGQLREGNDYQQGLLRAVLGAELRVNDGLRAYGELASGQVDGRRDTATANFQNDASLQQLFVDAKHYAGENLFGAIIGRQEFSDGPRQLISLSDGPNLHRTWNGVRLYAHNKWRRFGAFDLRATRLQRAGFDEAWNPEERLQGLNASFILSADATADMFLDPFWFHSENPNFRSGSQLGLDTRNTVGTRLWGKRGELKFDWTLAHQSGDFMGRAIDAWGLFTVQSVVLSSEGWKPRLTAHIDAASGGGTYAEGTLNGFNPLYASSNYLGEGQFLSLSNLLMVAPGITVSPTAATTLSAEYGFARRLDTDDAAYAGGMRAYAGSQNVPGHELGGLLRVIGTWSVDPRWTVFFNYEHFDAGDVLARAGHSSGSYVYAGATFRY